VKLLSYLSFLAFLGSVSVAAVSLWLDRAWQNRTVAVAALFYAVWAAGMTFAYGSSGPEAVTGYRLSFFGSLLYAPCSPQGIWLWPGFPERRSRHTRPCSACSHSGA
jgi:hypothetical protein